MMDFKSGGRTRKWREVMQVCERAASSWVHGVQRESAEVGGLEPGGAGGRTGTWWTHTNSTILWLYSTFFFNFLLSSLIFKTALYTRTHRRHLAADQCNLINQLNHDAKLLPQIVSATVLEKIWADSASGFTRLLFPPTHTHINMQ